MSEVTDCCLEYNYLIMRADERAGSLRLQWQWLMSEFKFVSFRQGWREGERERERCSLVNLDCQNVSIYGQSERFTILY